MSEGHIAGFKAIRDSRIEIAGIDFATNGGHIPEQRAQVDGKDAVDRHELWHGTHDTNGRQYARIREQRRLQNKDF